VDAAYASDVELWSQSLNPAVSFVTLPAVEKIGGPVASVARRIWDDDDQIMIVETWAMDLFDGGIERPSVLARRRHKSAIFRHFRDST
jgi:hypothetical protein